MYELKKMERYLRVNLLGPGPRLMEKLIYRAAVSQRLTNTALSIYLPRAYLRMTLFVEEEKPSSYVIFNCEAITCPRHKTLR